MATFKLTTKYYIRVHDKNLPGEQGWKCDFEMNTARFQDFFSKEDFAWIDKFVTYEKILQEVFEDDGSYRSSVTEPLCVQEYFVEQKDDKFVVKKQEEKIL